MAKHTPRQGVIVSTMISDLTYFIRLYQFQAAEETMLENRLQLLGLAASWVDLCIYKHVLPVSRASNYQALIFFS